MEGERQGEQEEDEEDPPLRTRDWRLVSIGASRPPLSHSVANAPSRPRTHPSPGRMFQIRNGWCGLPCGVECAVQLTVAGRSRTVTKPLLAGLHRRYHMWNPGETSGAVSRRVAYNDMRRIAARAGRTPRAGLLVLFAAVAVALRGSGTHGRCTAVTVHPLGVRHARWRHQLERDGDSHLRGARLRRGIGGWNR